MQCTEKINWINENFFHDKFLVAIPASKSCLNPLTLALLD